MLTLKQAVERLKHVDRDMLRYANQQQTSQFIKIPDTDLCVGVHLQVNQNLEILESAGNWAVARIRGTQ